MISGRGTTDRRAATARSNDAGITVEDAIHRSLLPRTAHGGPRHAGRGARHGMIADDERFQCPGFTLYQGMPGAAGPAYPGVVHAPGRPGTPGVPEGARGHPDAGVL